MRKTFFLTLLLLALIPTGLWAQSTVTTAEGLNEAVGTNNANIQLGADILLSSYLNINGKTVTIDLNGHKLYRNITGDPSSGGHVIYLNNNAHLTLNNSTGTGSIEGGNALNGGAIFIVQGSSLTATNKTARPSPSAPPALSAAPKATCPRCPKPSASANSTSIMIFVIRYSKFIIHNLPMSAVINSSSTAPAPSKSSTFSAASSSPKNSQHQTPYFPHHTSYIW